MKVLIVDPDEAGASRLAGDLERHGHEVRILTKGGEALAEFRWAQLLITELDLADLDGVTVCREVRSDSDVAVIVLSQRNGELDRVLALRAGADDFVSQPYRLAELLARMEAVTRRGARLPRPRRPVIAHNALRIDPAAYEVRLGERPVEVTRKEFDLLKLLASKPEEVVTRERIMDEVWQDEWTPTNSRTIDTHVNSLRRKLGSREAISTVRGLGFRIGTCL